MQTIIHRQGEITPLLHPLRQPGAPGRWAAPAARAAALVLAAGTATAQAQSGAWAVGVDVETLRYQSTEYSAAGVRLNSESGRLPSVRLSGRWSFGDWFAEAGATVARNDVAYDGFTQLGLPLQTTTQLQLSQWGARAGRIWQVRDDARLSLSGGLEQLHLDRNILAGVGSLPLQETLNTTHAVVGMQWAQRLGEISDTAATVTVALDWMPALKTRIAVNSFGLFDPITLKPGLSQDLRLSLRLDKPLTQRLGGWIGARHQRYRPGETGTEVWTKNGVAAATVRYPGSEQSLTWLGAGLNWSF